jgi:hypothetical protein
MWRTGERGQIAIGRLSGPINFSPMAYFYYKNGEDISFDLVKYAVIPHSDPVSFSSFTLQ